MRLSTDEVACIAYWAAKAMDEEIAMKFSAELKKRNVKRYVELRKNGHIYPASHDDK